MSCTPIFFVNVCIGVLQLAASKVKREFRQMKSKTCFRFINAEEKREILRLPSKQICCTHQAIDSVINATPSLVLSQVSPAMANSQILLQALHCGKATCET
jgi:hypothetical protein